MRCRLQVHTICSLFSFQVIFLKSLFRGASSYIMSRSHGLWKKVISFSMWDAIFGCLYFRASGLFLCLPPLKSCRGWIQLIMKLDDARQPKEYHSVLVPLVTGIPFYRNVETKTTKLWNFEKTIERANVNSEIEGNTILRDSPTLMHLQYQQWINDNEISSFWVLSVLPLCVSNRQEHVFRCIDSTSRHHIIAGNCCQDYRRLKQRTQSCHQQLWENFPQFISKQNLHDLKPEDLLLFCLFMQRTDQWLLDGSRVEMDER